MYTRTRTQDNVITSASTRILEYCKAPSTTTVINGSRSGVYKVTNDVVVPGFKARSAAGEVFNNPCNIFTASVTSGGSGFEGRPVDARCDLTPQNDNVVTRDYWGHVLGNIPLWIPQVDYKSAPTTLGIDVNPLITEASTKALAGVKAPDVQGIVLVAEIQKTLQTLRSPVKSIIDYVRKVRKKGKGRAEAQAISSQYLATYYGIMPILCDIEGIMKALQHRIQERYTSRGNSTITAGPFSQTYTSDPPGSYKNIWSNTTKCTATVRAGCLYELSAESQFRMFGVQPSDIPAALWEMTPWSFVVDWLTNVGDVIAAITPIADVSYRAQWITTTFEYEDYRQNIATISKNPLVQVSKSCDDWERVLFKTYTRTPVNLANRVGFVFKPNMNTLQILAAISLVTQFITKRR